MRNPALDLLRPGARPRPEGEVSDRRSQRWTDAPTALLLMTPALLVIGVLGLFPIVLVLVYSVEGPQHLRLDAYVRFFSNPRHYAALLNTIGIAVLSTLGSVVVSLPLAFLLRRSQRYRALMRMLITLPLMVPVLIAAYALTLFFANNGLFNYLLVQVLHLVPQRLQISYSLTGVMLACIWRYFPFVAIVVAAALESLDPSLEEAAASMGASPARAFRDVVLPLLQPSILAGSILVIVGAFGTFSIPLIMGRGQDVLSVLVYRYFAVSFDTVSASVVATVMVVIQVALLIFYTRVLRRSIG